MFALVYSTTSLGSYALLAAAVVRMPWLAPFCWPMMGLVLYGFASAAHECAHGKFARTDQVNRIAGALWSAPLLLNFEVHRAVHLRHHANLGRTGDPEALSPALVPGARAALLRHLLGRATVWKPLYRFNWAASRAALRTLPHRPEAEDRARALSALILVGWIGLTVVLTLHLPLPMLLAYWVPATLFAPFVFTLLSFPEHVLIAGSRRGADRSRTVRSNALVRLLVWNINLHTAHHLDSRLPFHALPAADRSLGGGVAHRAAGYRRFYRDWMAGQVA